ncbi:MAG: ABC transporter permease [Schleiferiaceae bacterium]|nr:ABC transporter permease [Schleiferiaceae bacterium]
MFDKDLWSEIAATLGRNKWRTVLTAFGVFWGITLLIIMIGSGNGLNNGVSKNMSAWATNSVFLWSQSTTMPYKGFVRGRGITMVLDDLEAIRSEVPEVSLIVPRNQLGGFRGANNVIYGKNTGAFSVYGDYPEILEIENKNIQTGRFLNQRDIDEKRKVCVIGQRVVEMLFTDGQEPIGAYIQINGVYFMVVGTYESLRQDGRAEEDRQSIYVPFSTFQQTFNFGKRVSWFTFMSQPDVPASLAEAQVKEVLKRRHSVHPEDRRAFGSFNLEEQYLKMQGVFGGIRILSFVVGIFTLLAGAIGVSNIMLVVIKERTREIGIRRAVGATPFNIIFQVVLESVTLTTIAGVFGIIFGVWLLEFVDYGLQVSGAADGGSFVNPNVGIQLVLSALGILVGAGLLAGIIPALRAVQIKPVEALRSE